MSDVEATESGASRAEDSKARAQHAGYGARPGGRPRRPGRNGLPATAPGPERHL